ncbi:mucin-1-like [Patiria miniata]|uniref:Uncharacterized protein n=1 Tax=Patiria miniata TaxID=46514 RepID=A0A913ZXQ7_PATMI|nr:mucin-1-like [Patiria miniata]XP_038056332.1 mucin-1-like [Patiria miniata]
MASIVSSHLAVLCMCFSICLATNGTSLQLQPSPSPALMPASIDLSGTSGYQILASSSVVAIRPQTSILPSGPQSFQSTRTLPSSQSLLPMPTPTVHPTPTPSSLPYSTPQAEVLHTPTPSPTLSMGLESPVTSTMTDFQTSRLINASQSDQWQSSSALIPPPPVPPPFPTSLVNMTEGVTDGFLTSSPVTMTMPGSSQQMTMTVPSDMETPVPFVTSTSYETVTMLVATPLVSHTPQTMSIGPSMTFKPMATQSFVMNTVEPTLSSSDPTPTPSVIPSSEPWDNDTLPTSETTQSTDQTTSNATVEVHTAPPKLTPVQCTMTLNGDCNHIKKQEQLFQEEFAKFIADLLKMDVSRLTVQEIRCGSIIVDFTIQDTEEEALAEDLMIMAGESDLEFVFDNQNFTVTNAVISTPKPTKKPPDGKGGLTFIEQQRLIYIVIGSAAGVVILISIILVIHHRARKSCSTHAQSFDIHDEPHIKLSDFNMAHTYIPRPRSIYGSRLGADGVYHANSGNGSLHRGGPKSPTPYVYADDEAIREHYHEVVTREPNTRMSQDFGRSGVPELNLPKLEGVYIAGQDEENADESLLRPLSQRRGSDGSTVSRLSATFHAPPDPPSESPPTPPPPSPPLTLTPPPSPGLDPPTLDLPPPPPLPPPTPTMSSTPLAARLSQVSDGSSSEATISIPGDTSFLLYRGCDYDPQPMGIDNPSYDRCTASDHEGAVKGQRAPSFYSMTAPASV